MENKFININGTNIKKSNIKTFGISSKERNDGGPIGAVLGVIKGDGFLNGFLGSPTKYLYITTYQNDNYTFSEKQINIDSVLRELEGI